MILKKLKKLLNDNKFLLLTIAFAILIIAFSLYVQQVTPFGPKSLLCVDFYHQYGPMTYEYVNRLKGGSSLVYSFYQGYGLPIFRNFINYLSSPFNLVLLFFNKSNHLDGLTLVIASKGVVSAGTCYYYFKKKFKKDNLLLIAISLLYAFSAYYRAYYWNLMWIDGMILLPLVTLGIENIINDNKWKTYLFSLTLMIISNYFIAYMICIYSIIYFIIYLIYKIDSKKSTKEIFKYIGSKILRFGGISLLAGGLSAFLMIPMASSMASISATGGSIPSTQYYSFEVSDFVKTHISGVKSVIFKSDALNTPNISVGIFSIFLLLNYITNLNIGKRNKICYLLLYIFFLSIFFIPQLDFIIQAFHVPNDLPYRYSFIYSFILSILCAYEVMNLDKESILKLLVSDVLVFGLLFIIYNQGFKNASKEVIIINMLVLLLYSLFLICGRAAKPYRVIFYTAIVFVAVIDLAESLTNGLQVSQVAQNFIDSTESIDNNIDYIKNYDESLFYRTEGLDIHTLNDSTKSFYYGATSFSSMNYESLAKLQKNIGNRGNVINSFVYGDQTPIFDLMFNIKYIRGDKIDQNYYTKLNYELPTYQFNNTVGIAYGVNEDILNWDYTNTNAISVQSDYVEKSTGIKNIFKPIQVIDMEEVQNDSIHIFKYTIENPKDTMYLHFTNSSISFVKLGHQLYTRDENYTKANDLGEYAYNNYEDEYLISASSDDDYVEILVGYNYYNDEDITIYTMDNDLFREFYNEVNNNSMTLTSFEEDKLSGQIYLNEDKIIYTSIPYDEGWNVYVNGEKVDTFDIGGSLLAFRANKGLNKIDFEYKIPHFKLGLATSIISLAITFQLFYLDKKKKVSVK